MSRPTVIISKFVGTISLGLLTGISYTLTSTTLPSLLRLPTATPAASTFRTLRSIVTTHQFVISSFSMSSFLLAYTLSPPRGRHPYLLWASLMVPLAYGADKLLKQVEYEGDDGGDVNGEAVREGMQRWRLGEMVKGGCWAVGWGMATVGIWGDGS